MKHHGHPRRPSIAITPDVTLPTPDSPFPKYDVKAAYADAVLRAGGLPFILPYTDERALIDQYLDRVSGLLITGGAFDIPPEAYGEAAKPGLGQLKPGRTQFEMSVLRVALQRKLPILGVCGGMQLLNVAYGGTLVQDIVTEIQGAKSHEQGHDRAQPHHPIEVTDHSVLAECVGGKGQLMVNSTHHQAVKGVGQGLVASATAPDGVIEAIEFQGKDHFVLGVQWHPELMVDTVPPNLGIYRALVNKARDRRH
ncbi:MAG: gamma-glutamyl-gamma-aminobutyrate hydrolase family protein [Myxococcaceae bacterium]